MASSQSTPRDLKVWMRRENIYDNDIYELLLSQGVEDPSEDFKHYTQQEWDVLWTKIVSQRRKEIKDQKAKVRLEKKMKKLEKYWRKQSQIKVTSIKKTKKQNSQAEIDPSDEKQSQYLSLRNSAAVQQDALAEGEGIKKYLRKNQCFSTDLVVVLVNMGVCSENDLEAIDSNEAFEEISRQVRVAKAKELKDNAAKLRMEKQILKFEKLWRNKTGIKKATSIKKKTRTERKKNPIHAKNEEMESPDGASLKRWMKKNDIWEMELYGELMANNITNFDDLASISQAQFEGIVNKVRVARFKRVKDQKERNRAGKLLVRFEKLWRQASGVKK